MMQLKAIPGTKVLDETLCLMKEGYLFIPNRMQRYHAKIFSTILLGRKFICISGKDAVKVFYDNLRFTRNKASLRRIQNTLFGKGGIQSLGGTEHRRRKHLFLSLMTPERIDLLVSLTKKLWQLNSSQWENREQIVLYDEVQIILCQAACKWAGIPLRKSEANLRSRDFGKMVDAFGAAGPRHLQGVCARKRAENWIGNLIADVRSYKVIAPKNTVLYSLAWYRDSDGKLLTEHDAAVEIINFLRPITAITTYVTFGALAIKEYAECGLKLKASNGNYPYLFAQEIRRYYPFAPFVGAKVRKNFVWHGYPLQKGTMVLLDIYGINHDSKLWDKPNQFLPERFLNWNGNPYDFIPQGGGGYEKGHRCPGEMVAIEIIKACMDLLVNHLEYEIPVQDLSFRLSRMPALPKSRFIISNVMVKSRDTL